MNPTQLYTHAGMYMLENIHEMEQALTCLGACNEVSKTEAFADLASSVSDLRRIAESMIAYPAACASDAPMLFPVK